MQNVFEVKDIPRKFITKKLILNKKESEETTFEQPRDSRPGDDGKNISKDVVENIPRAFYKITYGNQPFLTHRPYKNVASSNLWHVTTPPGLETRHLDCYNCGYKHTRRVCPLVKCHICCTFGHSQHVCPVRRIRNKKHHNNYVRYQD